MQAPFCEVKSHWSTVHLFPSRSGHCLMVGRQNANGAPGGREHVAPRMHGWLKPRSQAWFSLATSVVPWHTPALQWSSVVQTLKSSHMVLLDAGVPRQMPL